jgi:hypothetical protein
MKEYLPLEFPKGHPIHEVPLHGKDQFGHLPKKSKEETPLCAGSKFGPYCCHPKSLHNGKRGSCRWSQGEQLCWCKRFMPSKQKRKKSKPAWALKHRKTKKISYWYIDYHDGVVFVILGATLTPWMDMFWRAAVSALNTCNATASADLSVYGIK